LTKFEAGIMYWSLLDGDDSDSGGSDTGGSDTGGSDSGGRSGGENGSFRSCSSGGSD